MKGWRQESTDHAADLSISLLFSKAACGMSGSWIHAQDCARDRVFSLNEECSGPKLFSAHKSVDQTEWFYDLLEYTQWFWCHSFVLSLWAYIYVRGGKIHNIWNIIFQVLKLFEALIIMIPVVKWMNQTPRTWFWSAVHHCKLRSLMELPRSITV